MRHALRPWANTTIENGHLPLRAGEVLWTGERRSPVLRFALTFGGGAFAALAVLCFLAAHPR